MPISGCLVLLEVYFNQQLESLKSDKKLVSYDQNTNIGQNRAIGIGTTLTCTGTGSVLEGCTGTVLGCTGTVLLLHQLYRYNSKGIPVQVSEICPEMVNFTIFHALFFPNSLLFHSSSKINMKSLQKTPQIPLIR